MFEPELIREVGMTPLLDSRQYVLRVWDLHRSGYAGKAVLRYEFTDPFGTIIFAGDDFECSPMHASDSDETMRAILGFLTMRPGDTDDEYFENYNTQQMTFVESIDCEILAMWTEEDSEEEFEDIK